MAFRTEDRWLRIAEGLLSRPTAPCLEHGPADEVRRFAARRPSLRLSEDEYGSLLVKYPARGRPASPPLVLIAHLDHPGFVVESVRGRLARLAFRGGVRLRHARPGTRLDFFRPGADRRVGSGVLVSASSRGARRPGMLGSGTARVTRGMAEAGGFTMWAFPGFSRRAGRIASRCIDDLLGAAAAIAVLDEVHRRRPRGAHVWGYFTRAEEIGLFGALAGIKGGVVPRNARVISLETSRALGHARPGDGVIVRVGDAMSVFDPTLTEVLCAAAREAAAADRGFRWQRKLMDGGTCEASAFCAAGYAASGLALPLENYHNMKGLDGGAKGIGPERIRENDFLSEVKVLLRLVERGSLAESERQAAAWLRPAMERADAVLKAAPLRPDREGRR
jgi:endoglucanase